MSSLEMKSDVSPKNLAKGKVLHNPDPFGNGERAAKKARKDGSRGGAGRGGSAGASRKDGAGNKRSLNATGKNARSNNKTTRVKTTVFKKGGGVDRTGTQRVFERSQGAEAGRGGGNGVSGRFGAVMSKLPSLNMPRHDTVSIALPTSIIANAQTKELKTYLCGQLARAAAIHAVDEIVIYEDVPSQSSEDTSSNFSKNPLQFMQRLLEYAETPQYLKRSLFPNHADLQFVGLLPPVDAPHHVRRGEASRYREGVALAGPGGPVEGTTRVNCGVGADVVVPGKIPAGARVTCEIEDYKAKQVRGKAVASSAPRETDGVYWGYMVRGVKGGLKDVLDGGQWQYDLKIGTSERGEKVDAVLFGNARTGDPADGGRFSKPYKHLLIVFGGVNGIEQCVDDDENFPHVSGDECGAALFDAFVNTVPLQGSRTVRTEEAVLLTLAKLRSACINNTKDGAGAGERGGAEGANEGEAKKEQGKHDTGEDGGTLVLSDEELSEESDDDDDDDDDDDSGEDGGA